MAVGAVTLRIAVPNANTTDSERQLLKQVVPVIFDNGAPYRVQSYPFRSLGRASYAS